MIAKPAFTAFLTALALAGDAGAESFQPKSHVTRGIYADLRGVLQASVWKLSPGASSLTDDRPHAGRSCLRCIGTPDRGQGAGQRVILNQTEPRPVKIAGWSRAADVRVDKPYRYSVYVDFTFTDGKRWFMKLAPFEPGTHDWQYTETIVKPPKPLAAADVHVFLREGQGTAWFDDLFVGEAQGANLLLSPGFERDTQHDRSQRAKLFADLASLHANAIHGYLPSDAELWDSPLGPQNELLDFLRDAGSRGIGVWLTLGERHPPIRDHSDPNFPQYDCVNGPWGAQWAAALAKAARYPWAGISVVPDEYNCDNGRLKEAFAKHADPAVREFYARLDTYCTCPECRRQFAARHAAPFPPRLPRTLPQPDASSLQWLAFRYDSTTRWIARCCQAVKQVNPAMRTDSLICVSPICSDFWYGSGVAWERLGYEAKLEYPTTDPYILLHNYRGDSTHWYVTETTEHLAACSPERRCGVVLEGSRLRREYRELDPVEIYGSALSAVWHGADELAWFHHHCIFGTNPLAPHPEMNRAAISGVYGLCDKIDPWLDGITPEPGVAVLFSRVSCDAWRLYADARPAAKPPFDTAGVSDPRWASQVQKEALYLLLRTGTPATLYYLETVRPEELKPHSVILVPFPLAIAPARAKLLDELARAGKRVIVCGSDGPLDANAAAQTPAALGSLLGNLTHLPAGQEMAERPLGQGSVVYLARSVLDRQAAHREHEKRTHTERVLPGRIDAATAQSLRRAIGTEPLLADRLPDGDDVELCLARNRRGDRLLLAINWDLKPRSLALRPDRQFDAPAADAYTLGPDGRCSPWKVALRPTLRLGAQEAVVVRWPAP